MGGGGGGEGGLRKEAARGGGEGAVKPQGSSSHRRRPRLSLGVDLSGDLAVLLDVLRLCGEAVASRL